MRKLLILLASSSYSQFLMKPWLLVGMCKGWDMNMHWAKPTDLALFSFFVPYRRKGMHGEVLGSTQPQSHMGQRWGFGLVPDSSWVQGEEGTLCD